MISVKREEVGKPVTARFNKSVSVEDLEKVGCLNFNALHKIAVERCKRHFDYDGSAYVCEYTCVGGKEKTQHSYIPTEDRFVCTIKRCSDRDFLQRLSIQDDLSFAYDFLKEEKKNKEPGQSRVGVPFIITSDMHRRLYKLGYNDPDINKMTPAEAWAILDTSQKSEEDTNSLSDVMRADKELQNKEEKEGVEVESVFDSKVTLGKEGRAKNQSLSDHGLITPSPDMARQMKYLVDKLIPIGKVTVLAGEGGASKSYVTLAIGAAISRGYGFPYTTSKDDRREPRVVLYYIPEDPLNEIVIPRLIGLKANMSNFRIESKKFSLVGEKNLNRLVSDIEATKPDMVVIDPATAYCGGLNLENRQQALDFVYSLDDVASKSGVPIIANLHFNKDSDAPARKRIAGSAALVDASRSALVVYKHPDNPKQNVIVQVKRNYTGKPKSLVYQIEDDGSDVGKFDWIDFSEITEEDLSTTRDRKLENFIIEKLSECEDMLSVDLNNLIKGAYTATSEKQIRSAKDRLGITRENRCAFQKEGSTVWYVRLPDRLKKKI